MEQQVDPERSVVTSVLYGAATGLAGALLFGGPKVVPGRELLLDLLASADSLGDLKGSNRRLQPGSTLIFELDLRDVLVGLLPIEKLFDLAGAETLFRAAMPDGVELVDVRGERDEAGPFAVIEARVADSAPGSSRVPAVVIPLLLGAALSFVAKRWLLLTIVGIVGSVALASVVTGVRVLGSFFEGLGEGLGDFGKALPWLAGGVGALVLIGMAGRRGRT